MRRRLALMVAVTVAVVATVLSNGGPGGATEGTRYLDLVFESASVTPDLLYGRAYNQATSTVEDLALDLYRPAGDATTDRPAVIWVHGGSFINGSRKGAFEVNWATDLARRGYVAASISYRLGSGPSSVGITAAQHDAQAAVRWLRANATTYGIDPDRIAVMGYSAGAVTAIEVAQSSLETGASGAPGESSWVCFASSQAGGTLPLPDERSAPIVLFHATGDPVVPLRLAEGVHNAWTAAGRPSTLFTYPGGDHLTVGVNFADVRSKLYPIMKQHLVDGDCTEPERDPGGGFHPVAPTRLVDTRSGLGGATTPLGPGEIRTYDLAGVSSLPTAAPGDPVAGVVVNVTAVNPTEDTHLTVFPGGGPLPSSSTLNLPKASTRAGLAMVATPRGQVSVRNNSGSTHVVVDVAGWYDETGAGDRFRAVDPFRLADTRSAFGLAGALGAGATGDLTVADVGDLPPSATALVANVTGVFPSAPTHLRAWASGSVRPGASALNVGPGQLVPNLAVVPVGPTGDISLFNNAGTTDVLVDAAGAFVPAGEVGVTSGRFVGTPPTRLVDSRRGHGTAAGALGEGEVRTFSVEGLGGVPPAGVAAVVLTVTGVDPTRLTHLSVFPGGGGTPPNVSNLNLFPGQTAANLVVVPLGSDGTVAVRNQSGAAHLVVDVVGAFMA